MTERQIAHLCLRFKDHDNVYEFEDPSGADGSCEMASKQFIQFLRCQRSFQKATLAIFTSQEIAEEDGPVLAFYSGHKNVPVYTYQDVPHHWYRNGCHWRGHVVVQIGKVFVDWTARQFHPSAPFPLIFKME